MNQNDQSQLQNSILHLFECLSNSYVENPNLIENQLMNIYANQGIKIIPVLFDIFTNHPNINFRKRASFGLSYSIKKFYQFLKEDSIQQIWNEFFRLMSLEPNDDLIQFLVRPAAMLFNQINSQTKLGIEQFGIFIFFQSLSRNNFFRCIRILNGFLSESIYFGKLYKEFIIQVFNLSFQLQQKDDIILDIIYIGFCLICTEEIDDNTKNGVSSRLSQIFIELLNSNDKTKMQKIFQFYSMLNLNIQPLKMDIILSPTFQFLSNKNINIKSKCDIACLFSHIMSLDNNTKLKNDDLISLFNLSIYISVMVFDTSLDQSDPDSILMQELMVQCLIRIPSHQTQQIVISTFQFLIGQSSNTSLFDFGTASFFAKLFTALILVDFTLSNSAYLFMSIIPAMADFCISCLNAAHPGVQNMASSLLSDHITIFIRYILLKITDIVNLILTNIDNNKFLSGYNLLHSILCNGPDEICDQLFPPLYSICMKKLNFIVDSNQTEWVLNSLILMCDLFRYVSDEICCSHFDELFPFCINIINTYYQTQLQRQKQKLSLLDDNRIQYSVLELIGSFSYSCHSKLQSNLEGTMTLLINLLQFEIQAYFQSLITDLSLCQSLLHCLKNFVSKMTKAMSPYIDKILPLILHYSTFKIDENNDNYGKLVNDAYETYEMILMKKKDFSQYFTSPIIDLILKILKYMQDKLATPEIILRLFSIVINSKDTLSQNEVLSSIKLLTKLVIFVYKISKNPNNVGNVNCFETIKLMVPFVIEILNYEIEVALPDNNYDVFISCLKCISTMYINFGIEVFCREDNNNQQKCLLLDIMNVLIGLAESEYQDDGSLRFNQKLHDTIEKTIIDIIKFYNHPDFSIFIPFIPRFCRFLNERNTCFHMFSISILTAIVQQSSIIDANLANQLFERSVKSIIEGDVVNSRYFALFLSNLRFYYSQLLISHQEKLIQLIDKIMATADPSKIESRFLIEYLLALFASIDYCIYKENNNLTDLKRFDWFISFLPIQKSQQDNNQIIIVYLLNHYLQFPEVINKVLSLFCQIFISDETIRQSSLSHEIIYCLYGIIMKSQIVDNPETISLLFNGNQNAIRSFYETMQKCISIFSNVKS